MSKHSECANHVRRGDVLIRVDGVDVGDIPMLTLEMTNSWETNGATLKKYTKATGTPMIV